MVARSAPEADVNTEIVPNDDSLRSVIPEWISDWANCSLRGVSYSDFPVTNIVSSDLVVDGRKEVGGGDTEKGRGAG